ncbi:MAG: thioredoxin [Chloroflexota bacterium]|nr:thioredoxin [Chloroflexota bacterium]
MGQWEEDLPPLVRARLARIGEASPEEKARMKELQDLDSLLARFFKDEVEADEFYERLKEYEGQGKQFLLHEAQARLKESFKEKDLRVRFEEADDGRLAVRLVEEPQAEEQEDETAAAVVMELTADSFDEAVRKHRLMVVDCWAEWCGPCRMVTPVIEELAKEYRGRVAFGKLNIDENRSIAARYGVMSIPTLLVFKDWQLVDQIVGAMPKHALEQRLSPYLD